LIAYLGDLEHMVGLVVILSLIFYLSRVIAFTRNTGVNRT